MKRTFLVLILVLPLIACATLSPLNRNREGAAQAASPAAEATYHYSLGVIHSLHGNLAGAVKEYRAAMAADPRSPVLALELSSLYVKGGRLEEAAALCEQSLTYNPDFLDLHVLLGSIYFEQKKYFEANREFRNAVKLDPKALEAYLYLSVIYAEQRKYAEAIVVLKDLLHADPDNLLGHYYLAKRYADMGMNEESERWFRKTLALKPDFESAVVDFGLLLEKENKLAEAIKVYNGFIEHNPDRVDMKLRMGKVYLRNQKYPEAARVMEDLLKRDPSNREVRLTLGIAYFLSGPTNYDRACDEFRRVLKEDPFEHRAIYFLASAEEGQKRYGEALAEFEKIPETADLFGDARIHMANILRKEGKSGEAIRLMQAALQRKKGDLGLYRFLAALYQEDKRYTEAVGVLKEGLILSPNSIDLRYRLGVAYEAMNRLDDSLKEMEAVLRIDPEHADALNFIGYSYADKGIKLNQAEEMIRKALRIKPGNGYITDSLGWVYFKQNKTDLALRYLKEASAIMPDDPLITEHLGDAYAKAGMIKEALATYRRALKLNPKQAGVSAKIERLLKATHKETTGKGYK